MLKSKAQPVPTVLESLYTSWSGQKVTKRKDRFRCVPELHSSNNVGTVISNARETDYVGLRPPAGCRLVLPLVHNISQSVISFAHVIIMLNDVACRCRSSKCVHDGSVSELQLGPHQRQHHLPLSCGSQNRVSQLRSS